MEYLKYALLNENLVHINEVPKGLNCGCVCPSCRSPLVAKKGNLNAHHFAHYNRSDCNHGAETALHIMAKNIVAQSKKIWVPVTPKNVYGHPKTGKVVLFEKAELEKQLSDTVRSDILLSNGDRYLNVEIHVTHEVNIKK